jgi:excisionase family DNA binding protein
MATQKILTITEVAELLKVHPITVYRMIKQGKLPVFRIGRVLRFDADQLQNWLHATERTVAGKDDRRRRKPTSPSSAEYVAYRRDETFNPERALETLAIDRSPLVRTFVEAQQVAGKRVVCERCSEADKPIAALLLFASVERAKRPWKKTAMPFCRTCFVKLRRLAAPEPSGRLALDAASRTHHREASKATEPKSALTPHRGRR